MLPAVSTVCGWQTLQPVRALETGGWLALVGGMPWQLSHCASAEPPVQRGAVFLPPAARVAPWQYVEEQVAVEALHDGLAPPEVARLVAGSNVTAATPSTCDPSV